MTRRDAAALLFIVGFGVWLLAPNLGHPSIHSWDESFHQAAARGTYDAFWFPHLYENPLYPTDPRAWWASQVWLHKPPGPLWVAALVMHVIGVTPLALRLVSLLGMLAAAAALYFIARRVTTRGWAALVAVGFLSLPFGWQLTHGYWFGDVTDCTLVGCVTVAMALLLVAVERDSVRWATAVGAVVGAGFLCKSVLALTPLGVAVVLAVLQRRGVCKGVRGRALVAALAAFAAVALPWNLYAALKWPEASAATARVTLAHFAPGPTDDVHSWVRPWDAVLNELNTTELTPLPGVLALLAAVWLLVRAVRQRESNVIALALWLWATWLVHSIAQVKVPAQVFSAVPAVFAATALLCVDAWRRPVLASATLGAMLSPWVVRGWPPLGSVREALPAFFVQTRAQPGLAEGIVVVVVAAGVAAIAARRLASLATGLGAAVTVGALWLLVVQEVRALVTERDARQAASYVSYSRELGLSLDARLPKQSALFFQAGDMDPPDTLEQLSLMFYSGRMVFPYVDVGAAHAKGYHPYVISPVAERFAAVPGAPAHAWLRAYDLDAPAEPAPLPDGVTLLPIDLGAQQLLAFAAGSIDGRRERWAFYLHPAGVPQDLRVVFHLRSGVDEEQQLAPEKTLRARERLAGVAWFVLPAVGPPRSDVESLELGWPAQRVRLP